MRRIVRLSINKTEKIIPAAAAAFGGRSACGEIRDAVVMALFSLNLLPDTDR
jgi:hypothetical protein